MDNQQLISHIPVSSGQKTFPCLKKYSRAPVNINVFPDIRGQSAFIPGTGVLLPGGQHLRLAANCNSAVRSVTEHVGG